MSNQKLCDSTKAYLCRFYEILDTMIQRMTEVSLTDSISHDFICQMIPHHRAAIEMCRNVLQYTNDGPVCEIARHIIAEQTRSIADMERALSPCSHVCDSRQSLCQYQRQFQNITRTMFAGMGNACADNNISGNFMREMIPHHEGAVCMCQNALRFPICEELKPILYAIITSQKEGIRRMECLLESGQYR